MNSQTRFAATVLLAALSASCAGTRHSGQVGVASLESDFEPVDQQFTVGWSMSQDLQASGLTYEAGVQVGRDTGTVSGVAVSYTNLEFYGGPRYEFVLDKVHPYLSGGVSLLSADLEGSQ